jgi:sulfur carrier protein
MTCDWNWRKIRSIRTWFLGGTQALRKPGIACSAARSTQAPKVIEVNVNGATRRFDQAIDVAALLERLQLAGKRVAVERNGEIVPRSRFAQTALADGDRLEIVVAVGGG